MKRIFLFFIPLSFCVTANAQRNDEVWYSFYNQDSTLVGFHDGNGVEKIRPKFTMLAASRFEHIIAVTEKGNPKAKSYYLTKAGRIVGRDSLHYFDNGMDCESEGFIRFRDHATDKAGLFDRNGDIAVPAQYNDLTRVHNGLVMAIKDAVKKQWGEHYRWVGGSEVLLDTANTILIDSFPYNDGLNLYAPHISEKPEKDTAIWKTFLGRNGQYYAFIDYEKEFKLWLTDSLLPGMTMETLLDASNETIVWQSPGDWEKTKKDLFLKNNFDLLQKGMREILQPDCNYFISKDGLNPFIYEEPQYAQYIDDDQNPGAWRYPVMEIVVSHGGKGDFSQNHYDFLRTDQGYKLISVTIRNGKIKAG
ncbi:MAG: hypothetical protein QM610_07750 [Chitinophagaceae bacterium]